MVVIPVLGNQRQAGPWASLANQCSPPGKLQGKGRSYLQKQDGKNPRNSQGVFFDIHTYENTHIHEHFTPMYLHTH